MRIRMMGAALALSAGVGLGAVGGGANAALEYYRVWGVMDAELASVLVTGETLSLAPGGVERLGAGGRTVGALLGAARSGGAEWGVDLSAGPGTLVPHLGEMRASAKIVAGDALRCAAAGDGAGAGERAAAVFRMSMQSSGDEILISSLVGMAVGNLGVQLTEQLIDGGSIGAAEAAVVLGAIRAGEGADRYAMEDAIVGEWRLMSEFIVKHAPAEDPGGWLMEQAGFAEDAPAAEKLLSMSRSEMMRELGGFAEYHADLLAAWKARDSAALEEAERGVEAGAYGVLTELLGATLTRAYASDRESEKRLGALVERLEGIIADG